MTAQKYLDKHAPRRYFGFVLRQNWPSLVTNTIFFVVINVLILSLSITDRMEYITDMAFQNRLIRILEDYRVINVVIASCLAVLWGCTTMSYLNSKVGVNFYHSLPVTRESHYVQEVGCKILWFIVPMAASSLFGYLSVGIITGRFGLDVASAFFQIFLYSSVYFLVFFAIMIFCASFTGTGFARLLSAGMIVFMPALLIWVLSLLLDYSAQYADYTWLSDFAGRIILPVRAVLLATGEVDNLLSIGWELTVTVLIAAAFLVVGVVIYKRRKSELSGTPVLSKIAAGVMKYSAMFAASSLFALALEDLAGGIVGMVIGCVVGALLAMMLMNTILTKSAKKMFSGLPGLAATCVTFAVLFGVFGLDAFGIDRYVPAANMVRSIGVEVYNIGWINMELDDEDEIARVTELVDGYLNGGQDRDELLRQEYRKVEVYAKTEPYLYPKDSWERDILTQAQYMMTERITFRVSFRTVSGVRFDKRYTAYLNGEQYELLTILAESDGFVDAFFGDEDTEVFDCSVRIINYDYEHAYSHYKEFSDTQTRQVFSDLRASYNGSEYFNRPVLATIQLSGTNWYEMPFFEATDVAVDAYMDTLTSIWVVNTKTGEMKEYTDPAIMEDILSAGVIYVSSTSGWCPKDDTYVFFGMFGDEQDYNYICAYFLKDHVPVLP